MGKSPKDDIKYLETKLKKNPNSILFARLADAYASVDRIDEAIQVCESGLRKHPYYVTGHYIMSKCYLLKKQFDHAEKELKRVLLFDSAYIAAHKDYGELMSQIGWNSSCELSFEKILTIDPLNKLAAEKIRQIRENLRIDEDAEKEFELDDFDSFTGDAIAPAETDESVQSEKEPDQEDETSKINSDDSIDNFDELFEDTDETSDLENDIFSQPEQQEQQLSDSDDLSEHDQSELSSAEPDEEKFSYILDDIFRDDEINTSEQDEESDIAEAEPDVPAESNIDNPLEEDDIDTFTLDEIEEMTSTSEEESIGSIQENVFEEDIADNDTVDNLDKWFDDLADETNQEESVLEPDINDSQESVDEPPEPEADSVAEIMSDKNNKPKSKEKIVTPTLGEIYAAQHQYAKAIGVYEILKKNNPDNPIYEQKIEYLKRKLEESQED